MPRPCKRRRICALPGCSSFGPVGERAEAGAKTVMTVDEFECIRLIDLEGMTQEECASQMNVARTTAQAIYASARCKLAECLVNGRELEITGGDYVLCGGGQHAPRCESFKRGRCAMCRLHNHNEEENVSEDRGDI